MIQDIKERHILAAIILAGVCANPEHRYGSRYLVDDAIDLANELYETLKSKETEDAGET